MDWKKTYPDLATAMAANLQTLCTWCDNLPPPQTDVQRTVWRRMQARRDQLMGELTRKEAPHIADKFNSIIDKMEALGIKSPVDRM